ncbi:MAG: sulfatase, partial [Planctomycetes bacterium]|nr:sulfatase [Planctomycetota bacterium]
MLKPTRDTLSVFFVLGFVVASQPVLADTRNRPNVLVAISDDQSYPHASAYGYEALHTPAFDRVAKMGVLFQNAFTPAPGCSPMRAAFLTGRHVWQIEHAGTHASTFPAKYEGFQERLGTAGYFVGFTGKGWAPGNWKDTGRATNPAGPEFSKLTLRAPEGIRSTDYAANFAEFLRQRPKGKPFSFWYGASEPHRKFKKGIGREHGLDPAKIVVPGFLPDTPEIRDDILDYCYEVEWFDEHLGRMLNLLEEQGELDNTIVIVTSDNGMAFPRAKANVYEYGIHMPLAVAWP